MQLAQSYTDNLSSLIKMLRETYLSQANRSIKNRISRLSKNLNYMVVGPKKRTMKMNFSHLRTQTRTPISLYHQRTPFPLIYTSNPNLHMNLNSRDLCSRTELKPQRNLERCIRKFLKNHSWRLQLICIGCLAMTINNLTISSSSNYKCVNVKYVS